IGRRRLRGRYLLLPGLLRLKSLERLVGKHADDCHAAIAGETCAALRRIGLTLGRACAGRTAAGGLTAAEQTAQNIAKSTGAASPRPVGRDAAGRGAEQASQNIADVAAGGRRALASCFLPAEPASAEGCLKHLF